MSLRREVQAAWTPGGRADAAGLGVGHNHVSAGTGLLDDRDEGLDEPRMRRLAEHLIPAHLVCRTRSIRDP
ncbi:MULTISPECIES: hypothetical protein [Rhodococcus]|uniref:hypothetical protein n=1 Tax=Rhodococcus TaxID=1827 RepID=UPI001A4BDAF9|nr:hypothetical protein [Rhodococcus qingshengii]ULD45050.1 hypothetical protein JKI97_31955 [Rhodococcus qingshengii]